MSEDERKHLEGLDEATERERWEEFHTDRAVRLSGEELARMNCDCAEPYGWDDHTDSCFVPVVESIVAFRERAAAEKAWDEGRKYETSRHADCHMGLCVANSESVNPYRQEDRNGNG